MKKIKLNFKKYLIFILLTLFLFLTFSFTFLKANENEKRDLNYYKNLTKQLYEKNGIGGLYEFLLFSKPLYTPNLDVNKYNLYSKLEDSQKQMYNEVLSFYKTLDKPLNEYRNNELKDHIVFTFTKKFSKQLKKEQLQDLIEKYSQVAVLLYQDFPNIYFTSGVSINLKSAQDLNSYNIFLGFENLFSNINTKDNINYLIDYIAKREYLVFEVVEKDTNNDGIISNFERIKNAHDWLYQNNEYNSDALKLENKNKFSTFMSHRVLSGILDEFSPVCEGYAYSFKVLMDRVGIPTIIGTGKGYTSKDRYDDHAWNYVFLDGKWYLIDVTWDDPVGANSFTNHHKFFLRESLKDHVLYQKGENPQGIVLDYVIEEPSPMASIKYDINNQTNSFNKPNTNKTTLYTYLNKKAPEKTNITNTKNESKNLNQQEKTQTQTNTKIFNIGNLNIDIIHIFLFSLVIILIFNYLILLIRRKK